MSVPDDSLWPFIPLMYVPQDKSVLCVVVVSLFLDVAEHSRGASHSYQ